jgi:hypothetical protein
MFPHETSLASLSLWARGSGLEIALFVTGTILLTRLASVNGHDRSPLRISHARSA